jgi:transcription elongation factor GreA
MPEIHYLTAEGLARLKAEHANLIGPGREDLAKRLRHAIQQGDLSENADYIQAKEEQGFLEGRILELNNILNNYQMIDETSTNRTRVDIGAKVTIRFKGESYEESYQIVGPKEANPAKQRISHESPIGSALLGHAVGDEVIATMPDLRKEYILIVSIE